MASVNGIQLKQIMDPRLAKAFTHPLRGHVFVTIGEKGEASAKEIADELGIERTEVSYHFRELKRRKLIALHRSVKRRGFMEDFYRPTTPTIYFDDFDWRRIPEPVRACLSGDMLRQVVDEMIAALEAGSFNSGDRHLSRTWLLVDERGQEEAMHILAEALQRILKLQKACAKRLGKSSEAGIPVSVIMMGFETAAGIAVRGDAAADD